MAKWLLRLLNRLLSLVVGLVLVVAIVYSGFALWDNRQILASAENSLSDMAPSEDLLEEPETNEDRDLKTTDDADTMADEEEETELSELFKELKDINQDIGAWITMPGTEINYPVVRGENNIYYVSTDIYGSFAIVGSIFLDFRNKDDYTDTYNLLYGHNMSEHRMFSDVNLYKEEEFFNENQKGYFYLPTGAHWLQSISIIVTDAADSWMLNPQSWQDISTERMLELVQQNALFVSEEGMEALLAKIEAEEELHIVALSTCSNEFTDARTILLTLLDP